MGDVIDDFIALFKNNLLKEAEGGNYYRPRPYRNSTVRFRECSIEDFETRRELVEKDAFLNPFMFRANLIPGCDLLSDSGTTTMTMDQWAMMLLGDEAYGSNQGYFELEEQVGETFGPAWQGGGNLFIFHQGRAGESAFFSILSSSLQTSDPPRGSLSEDLIPGLKERLKSRIRSISARTAGEREPCYIIPSNSHFDTTEGNIENNWMIPVNLPCREHKDNNEEYPFRGNMDLEELESLLECEIRRVPLVYLTITNNTCGGQPVSMENIRDIRKITRDKNVPFFLDACRFAENAWYIKNNEDGYARKEIKEIVHEMFDQVDGFHISLKKDGLSNIGGAVVFSNKSMLIRNYPHFHERLTDYQIMTEGHPSYGGLAGRDLKAIAEGLRTVLKPEYLHARISQVNRFGKKLTENGIPIIRPVGGHAVYIDVDRFFDGLAEDRDLKGVSLTALMLIAGHRLCELGLYAFGKFDGRNEVPPDPRMNYVRAAVPRLTYEDQDLFSTAEAIKLIYQNRDKIPSVNVDYGRELNLRHFKSKFSFRK
jgi:tryptophanase